MLNITITCFNTSFDIQVNRKQYIYHTICILQQAVLLPKVQGTYVYVPRFDALVTIYQSYQEAGIRKGDILSIKE